jgi:hypothetical protein
MISAYTMEAHVTPDMRACASAILDLLLRWPPTPPTQTSVTQSEGATVEAVSACSA